MTAGSVLAQAVQLLQAEQLDEAELLLRRGVDQHQDDPGLHHTLGILLFKRGRLQEAIERIEQALTLKPNAAVLMCQLSELYSRVGDQRKAIQHGQNALAIAPHHVDALNTLGSAYLAAGEGEQALTCFRRVLAKQPRNIQARLRCGHAHLRLGRLVEAASTFSAAITLNPKNADAHLGLAQTLHAQGQFHDAVVAAAKALQARPGFVEAYEQAAVSFSSLGKVEDAVAQALRAQELAPDRATSYLIHGRALLSGKRAKEALQPLLRASALAPNDARINETLGQAYADLQMSNEAEAAYNAAIQANPNFADAYNNLGSLLRRLGRVEDSTKAFERALKLDPTIVNAAAQLAYAKKSKTESDEHVQHLLRQRSRIRELPLMSQIVVHFASGKVFDDLARFDDAFSEWRQGNLLMRRHFVTYSERDVLELMERIKRVFDKALLEGKAGAGSTSAKPIFVTGMPRSGTTLVEQILASHPSVGTAGEIDDYPNVLMAKGVSPSAGEVFPESVRSYSPAELTMLGDAYVGGLDKYGVNAERVIDKLTGNFNFLGAIRLSLPNAKIIHVRRDPLDTCLSCFSSLFAERQNHTYDLAELGRFYRAYHALMAHWRAVLPAGAFLDVDYENLIADSDTEARRIIEHCNLSWDDRVLDFYKAGRPVRTRSAFQVRQPIYRSSVGRWRNYEVQLAPLIRELGDLCAAV